MRKERLTVFIVDDDAAIRDSMALMLGVAGYRTSTFADSEALLDACRDDWAGCVVADVRLPGKSGVDLQIELKNRAVAMPFIIITAHADVATARAAFRANAIDFLEKPFDSTQLCAAIESAFALEDRRLDREGRQGEDARKLGRLTARERDVLELATRGLHAKEIAASLGISPRTVEVHKTRIMEKLDVRNVAELVRFSLSSHKNEAG